MNKDINIKERIVNMYDVDTGTYENEIINYLDKKMKVRFHSALFNNSKYTFIGEPSEQSPKSITISSYKRKDGNNSVIIGQ
jgi:hypothetical protein